MKLLPALVIANTLQWSFGKLRRIEQRPARQIQEYNADSSPSSGGDGESSTAHDSDVGVLSIKEHQENAIRHLHQTECAEWVDCVDGFVAGTDQTNRANKCKYACGVSSPGSYGGECCNADSGDACEGFTGKVCKDMDELTEFPGSCSGTSACKNANIVSVFKSCTGNSSCKDAGSNYGPSGTTNSSKGYVGELIDSCIDTASCLGIGSDGGSINKITSSCKGNQACLGAAGYANYFGGGGGTVVGIYNSCDGTTTNNQIFQACKLLGSKDGFVGIVSNSCSDTDACYKAAYEGGAIQEIYDSCMTERSCYGLTNPQTETRQRMLARKKTKAPKPANPNKPPAQAPKPANPNKPEPKPNPNTPVGAPGPTPPPVPDGALCLVNCCNGEIVDNVGVCSGNNTQAELVTKGECPSGCTPWGA